jgi:hypothetical protein
MGFISLVSYIVTTLSKLVMGDNDERVQNILLPRFDANLQVTDFQGLLLAPVNRRLCESFVINQVAHLKETRNARHELLVLELVPSDSQPDPPHRSQANFPPFVRAERSGGISQPAGEDSHSASPAGSSVSIGVLSKDTLNANDSLFIPGRKKHVPFQKHLSELRRNYDLLHTLTFSPSTRPSLAQVMVLMQVLSDHSRYYGIFKRQCYWYAGTLCETLKQLYSGQVTDDARNGQAGKYGVIPIVPHADPVDVQAILPKYRTEWDLYVREGAKMATPEEVETLLARERAEMAAREEVRIRELAAKDAELAALKEVLAGHSRQVSSDVPKI